MTRQQFALAVNADEKWIENTARLLGLALTYSQREARWMGLVRMFDHDIGLTLKRSAALATEAIRHPEQAREVRLGETPSGAAAIVVDLARYHSAHNAALSAALTLAGPRKRGRPSAANRALSNSRSAVRERPVEVTTWDVLARAKAYGVDLSALRDGLNETPAERLERLEDNSRFIAEMRGAVGKKTVRRQVRQSRRAR
ncbi:MAG TPA: hypothetical protein VFC35_06195 [Gemmatimonadaceae bacterium]|nr:hypothetical protein [Gemmatimonadaceae bacterium]